jgi:hypothetical protein
MPNTSDEIQDAITGHAVDLLRLAEGIRALVLADLEALETELVKDLEGIVGKTDFTLARLRTLLAQTRETIATAYVGIGDDTQAAMERLARVVASQTSAAVNAAVGARLLSVGLSREQLAAVARNVVVFGKFPWEWWKDQDVKLRDRFARAMRSGYYRGETVEQLVRRVRGTKARGFADGLMRATRAQAEALVRTSVIAVSNEARLSTYDKNRDVVKGVQWVSVLDERTTLICIGLDGKEWEFPGSGTDYADYEPIGHDKEFPGPTAHWNCRSTQVPITFSWDELSGRASTKSRAGRIPKGTRASMDGQVARATTYGEWLARQSDERQDEVLGPGRAELFRAGKLKVEALTDARNNPISLEDLEAKYGG